MIEYATENFGQRWPTAGGTLFLYIQRLIPGTAMLVDIQDIMPHKSNV
jgi:hypothetical protein